LVDHYAGAPSELEVVPLDLPGETDFQAAVRAAVRAIPRGEVRSYGDIAKAAGRPGAARAVGQVMAHNPVAPFVPCHRVVAANGSLGGFGGGLPMKRRLLLDEGYRCADS
jgi:methylated-DNA-[protein]-cysteine S-methyltransferase